MAGAEGLKSPNLHLTKTLTTELGLTSKRLLRDEAVRTNATGVHLVFDHVTELEEVGHANSSGLVELLTGLTIVEASGAKTRQTCLVGPLCEVVELSTIKDRSGELHTKLTTGSTEDGLEDLTEVHT